MICKLPLFCSQAENDKLKIKWFPFFNRFECSHDPSLFLKGTQSLEINLLYRDLTVNNIQKCKKLKHCYLYCNSRRLKPDLDKHLNFTLTER